MGSDLAPLFHNLFHYYYESKWIIKIKKTEIGRARCRGKILDYLTAFDDCGEFERRFNETYPPEFELKKEYFGYLEGSFLNLKITTKDKKYCKKLFDKRDSFPFSDVCLRYLDINIPPNIFYSAFGAELLRQARTTIKVMFLIRADKTV